MTGLRPTSAPSTADAEAEAPGPAWEDAADGDPDDEEPGGNERVVLIEFRWRLSRGLQPVIYADRRLLH